MDTPTPVPEAKKIYASWSISLNCECPKCGKWVDLLETPDFWDAHDGLQVAEHNTERTRGFEADCPECRHEFKVDLEY